MRFHGSVGYGSTVETSPGVWEEIIEEKEHFGDLSTNVRRRSEGETLHGDISLGHVVSIVADAYALENYFQIKYVLWRGQRWTVSTVEVKPPRLILYPGEVYNGPIPA